MKEREREDGGRGEVRGEAMRTIRMKFSDCVKQCLCRSARIWESSWMSANFGINIVYRAPGLCVWLCAGPSWTKFVFRRIRSSPSASVEPTCHGVRSFQLTKLVDQIASFGSMVLHFPLRLPLPPFPSLPKRLCGSRGSFDTADLL